MSNGINFMSPNFENNENDEDFDPYQMGYYF